MLLVVHSGFKWRLSKLQYKIKLPEKSVLIRCTLLALVIFVFCFVLFCFVLFCFVLFCFVLFEHICTNGIPQVLFHGALCSYFPWSASDVPHP